MPSPTRVLQEIRRFIATARPDGDCDRQLIERFVRTRDDRAFAELVRRHGPMVLGVCRRVLRHSADAEDAFQATFLILVRRAVDVRDPDRLGSWLYGVAWRTANKLRTTRRPGLPLPDDVATNTSSADWPVELDAAIARLPEKYRTPVVLCHLQGLSPSEVAGRLGCAPATIVTRLFRARATLRRRLTALGLSVPPALIAGSVLEVPSALATAVGEMAAGRTISPAAARLADGVFRSLLMTRIRWTAAAAAVCLGTVGVLGFRAGGQDLPPPTAPIAPPAVATPAPPPTPPLAVAPNSDSAPQAPGIVTSTNFRVSAPSSRIARLVADVAERSRKDQAMTWLGNVLPDRKTPWPIEVHLNHGTAGGASTFDFADSKIQVDTKYFAGMGVGVQPFEFPRSDVRGNTRVEGQLDRLLADVVPHEITHCVMAEYFRAPVPRWADEGMSILSESDEERGRHSQILRQTADEGRMVQIKALFASRDYPKDVTAFFAQSYWVTRFLVGRKDCPTFIKFVADGMKDGGMKNGWEKAARTHYGFETLNDLEKAMVEDLKAAAKTDPRAATALQPSSHPVLMVATADADDRIVVGSSAIGYRPTTAYMPRKAGKEGAVAERVVFEPVTSYQMVRHEPTMVLAPSSVQVFTLDGKPVETAKLLATVRAKPTPVVVASELEEVQQEFGDILKPGTMIIVLPAARPAPPPIVPPAIRQ